MRLIDSYIFICILLRAVLPLKLSIRCRTLLGAGAALVVFSPRLIHLADAGPVVSPDLPRPLLVIAAWSFAASFFFALLLVGADVVRIASWSARAAVRRTSAAKPVVPKRVVDLALLVAASLLASCGMANGVGAPEVFGSEVVSPRLPEELDGMRIVLVSDLHVDSFRSPGYLSGIVEKVDRLDPDLVAVAGDFADGKAAELAPRLEALRSLKSRYGVFGVPGNHEYYSGYRDYMEYLPTLGVTMLENSHRMIRPGFAVAGVTDPAAAKYHLPEPDLSAALAGIPAEAFVLLLAHRPDCGFEAAKRGVDLQLSGHLHGGLVWGLGKVLGRTNGGFVAGARRIGGTTVYVSRGTATWGFGRLGFQVRLGVPAEITLITLRRRK